MFEEFIGNESAKKLVSIAVRSAIKSNDRLSNMLYTGKAGIGKTYFASLVAKESDAIMYIVDGTSLKEASSQKKVLAKLMDLFKELNRSTKRRAILFIDEAHAVNKKVSEMFLRIISENIIQTEKGGKLQEFPVVNNKTGKNDFLSFIFATNNASEIVPALRSRLKTCTVPFIDYTEDEKTQIAEGYLTRKDVFYEKGVCEQIAKRAWSARDVESGCEGIYNYATAEDIGTVTLDDCNEYFEMIGVDENGLNPQEREYIECIKSSDGEASLNTIACKMGVPVKEITEIIEPKIIALGMIELTSKGRVLVGNNNMFEINK